ncbi:conserved exported hypothetical protein [Paraburkholderia piptadeniae]|uniref:Uncharacterized protein n=1 Tax=Paraburkholderia piptadeniae TaxID=1701573 RepID=A0A1N7RNC6_9BURK|nr:conserved exported hypothetical protein [Paraburkholderia piptadeniae]
MRTRTLNIAFATMGTVWCIGSVAAQPDYAYTTTVRVSDGKTLSCAVNEPLPDAYSSGQMLTRREQREADVLATQPLRMLSGPSSEYPSPYTAPSVNCKSIS